MSTTELCGIKDARKYLMDATKYFDMNIIKCSLDINNCQQITTNVN